MFFEIVLKLGPPPPSSVVCKFAENLQGCIWFRVESNRRVYASGKIYWRVLDLVNLDMRVHV